MILTLIALLALLAAGLILAQTSDTSGKEFLGVIITIVAVICLLTYAALVLDYVGAGFKKDIINREYKTNYTQDEIFYASKVIDQIRELDRKRIEINGDLITGETK